VESIDVGDWMKVWVTWTAGCGNGVAYDAGEGVVQMTVNAPGMYTQANPVAVNGQQIGAPPCPGIDPVFDFYVRDQGEADCPPLEMELLVFSTKRDGDSFGRAALTADGLLARARIINVPQHVEISNIRWTVPDPGQVTQVARADGNDIYDDFDAHDNDAGVVSIHYREGGGLDDRVYGFRIATEGVRGRYPITATMTVKNAIPVGQPEGDGVDGQPHYTVSHGRPLHVDAQQGVLANDTDALNRLPEAVSG